ncbi:MAG TPA: LysR family transcriptional regulator [Actinophytocola sp.]|uniref:LysR family transcriptional regulator n=1 Tax=Actinophytocola sp. TaxID=1872138 RepID=UPI002DDD9A66|nr:LysR family transcriptional regulator [Actinophytocola sp.]HEV2782134.1 LysR family transcriptional regulator [Actinophytocola sp.]
MFDLGRLRVLAAVADQGTLAAAADVLHLTPSAVSQQMAKLEREARCRLIERHGRRARLTEEGELLAKHARRILGAVAEAESDLDERRGQVLGELSVGAFPTAARGLLPDVLVTMATRYPRLRIRLQETESYEAMSKVSRGDLDVVVNADWATVPLPVPDRVCKTDIGADPADLALPAAHPLADRPRLSLEQLTDETWVASTVGTICYEWLTSTLRNAGHEPRISHQAAEFPTQLALVSAGLGVALMPRLAGDFVPPDVRLIPVDPTISRRVFAVWREETTRRPSVQAFLTTLREAWALRG